MEKLFKRKIFLILIFGFLIRFAFILTLKNQLYFDDEYEYLKIVDNFLSGKGFIISENLKSFRPPLYPLLLSLFKVLHFNLFFLRFFQVLISTFTVYLIYLISEEVFGEKVAILSSLISTFWPFFIFYNGFLLTETFFVFLVVLTLFYAVKLVDKDGKNSFKAGITMGFAGLTRPTIQIFLPVVLLLILSFKESLKIKFKKILFLSIGFSLVLSPWIIRNYKIFHKFIPGTTMGGWVFWEGNNPMSDGGPCRHFPEGILEIEETERDRLLYKMAIEKIKENPERFLWLLKNKFIRFWNIVPNAPEFKRLRYKLISIFSFGFLMPFFIIGFIFSIKIKKAQFFHSIIILFTIFHMIFLSSIRYRFPIEPFYIILSSFGILSLANLRGWQRIDRQWISHDKTGEEGGML